MKEQFLEAGSIVNTHGVRGEVKIEPWTDTPAFFRKLPRLFIRGQAYRVRGCRLQGAFVLVSLEGIDTLDAALPFKGETVYMDRDDVHLEKGRYFLSDLIGMKVVSEQGELIGELTEVLERPAQNIYVVQGEREILLPAVPEFILQTDFERGQMTVHLMDGL